MRHGFGGFGRGGVDTPDKPDSPHYKIFLRTLPFLWPKGFWLRCQVSLAFTFLIAQNAISVTIPLVMKEAVDALTQKEPVFPFWVLLGYGLLRLANNVCSQLRDLCWAQLSVYTEKTMACQTFTHIQELSLRWHLKRQTGAVLRAVTRGSSSFSSLLRIALFQILPVFIQVIIVCGIMFSKYSWYFAVITFAVIFLYFTFTFTTQEWRNKYRRVLNQKENEYTQKATDALLNFETVKYFNAERHEETRINDALEGYAVASIKSQRTLAVMNSGQTLVIAAGVTGAMWIAANEVVKGNMTVGDFVLVQSYILQLYEPLGFLGMYYQMVKQNIVDVEGMFKLLETPVEIVDRPGAAELKVKEAEVVFDNVSFSYTPDLPILKNVSFTVKPHQKIAIVGPSGSGKSTIARLLYRFFEVQDGRILIDGQDISQVTQVSLRKIIGIVPQDTVLFNDTIAYNIGYGIYGRQTSDPTEEELESAAKSAAIYNFIMTQKDKFKTVVGERGLRLSGGEKQRVAIARAFLKAPELLVFDEATSSLDSQTEKDILSALNNVAKGRSSITIAHRLSTIMNSDQILVLKSGRIVERGTHDELLDLGGEYKKMWDKQQEKEALMATLAVMAQEETEAAKSKSPLRDDEKKSPTTPFFPISSTPHPTSPLSPVSPSEPEGSESDEKGDGKTEKKESGESLETPLLSFSIQMPESDDSNPKKKSFSLFGKKKGAGEE